MSSQKSLGNDPFAAALTAPIAELGIVVSDPRGKSGSNTKTRVVAGVAVSTTTIYYPGNEYRYVKANSTIVVGDALKIDTAGTDANKPTEFVPTAAVTDVVDGAAHVAIATNSYAYVTIKGRITNVKTTGTVNEGDALGASGTAGTLVAITGSTPTGAEVIAAIRYAAGRRALALVNFTTNRWDIHFGG